MNAQIQSSDREHSARIREMFARIAPRYDLLNHLLSGNTDKRWRRRVAKSLADTLSDENSVVLDLACGTGDLAIELASRARGRVVGADFCRPMLEIAREKTLSRMPFVEGDAMALPFPDAAFDAVTIAFGLRNLANVDAGLAEMYRVLKHGGRTAILEFSHPVVPGLRSLFRFYFQSVLPRAGGWISGSRGAYEYLPRSVSSFPNQDELASAMREAGFTGVSYVNLTGGIAAIHMGTRP